MPTLKVATNTTLFDWMRDDMDLNAGTILDGTETVEEVGYRIFEEIVAVANGKRTKSEVQGLGDEDRDQAEHEPERNAPVEAAVPPCGHGTNLP